MLDDSVGAGGRKPVRRTAEERAAIVAESYQPGMTVSGVAQRHGVAPSQLSAWRSAARRRKQAVRGGKSEVFADVEVVFDPVPAQHDGVEIIAGGVQIRLPKSTPSKRIVEIARHLARP